MAPAKSKGRDGRIVLHVFVKKAKDLPKVDLFGKIDAYAVLQVNSSNRLVRTKVIDCSYTPVWEETFLMTVGSAERDILYIRLKDKDQFLPDQNVAKVEVRLKELQYGYVHKAWYALTPYPGFKKGGQIRLRLQLAPEGSVPFAVVSDAAPAQPNPASGPASAPGIVVQPAMASEFVPFQPVPIYIGYAGGGPRPI
jgi:hypothetical protein